MFLSDYPVCENLIVKLKPNIPDGLYLTNYVTSEECTIPNMQEVTTFGFTKPPADDNKVSLGAQQFGNCGLNNLVVVLYNATSKEYVDHDSQAFFVNCSNVDLGLPNLRFEEFVPISLGEPLQNLGSYMEVTYEGSGENEFFYEESNDDVMIKVTNNMDGNCDAKVMVCMWCPDGHEMEEWGLDTLEVIYNYLNDASENTNLIHYGNGNPISKLALSSSFIS